MQAFLPFVPLEDFPVVKSRASKLRDTQSKQSGTKQNNNEPNPAGPEMEEPFQVLQSARQFTVPELDDEAFLESLSKLLYDLFLKDRFVVKLFTEY